MFVASEVLGNCSLAPKDRMRRRRKTMIKDHIYTFASTLRGGNAMCWPAMNWDEASNLGVIQNSINKGDLSRPQLVTVAPPIGRAI